jgi:hypothetical protein
LRAQGSRKRLLNDVTSLLVAAHDRCEAVPKRDVSLAIKPLQGVSPCVHYHYRVATTTEPLLRAIEEVAGTTESSPVADPTFHRLERRAQFPGSFPIRNVR